MPSILPRSAHELLVIAQLIDRPIYQRPPEVDPVDSAAALVDAVKRNEPGLLAACFECGMTKQAIAEVVITCHVSAMRRIHSR